jgi:hypothetical protein
LETLVGATQAALDNGADLLVINRFGKRETEGAGFRQVIGNAGVHRGFRDGTAAAARCPEVLVRGLAAVG